MIHHPCHSERSRYFGKSRNLFSVKLKSSAILVAIVLGIVMSGIVVGVAAVMSEHMKLSAQARDGQISYQAALSGVEDGLMEMKFARSKGVLNEIMGPGDERKLNNNKFVNISSYKIDISQSRLTSYPFSFGPDPISSIGSLFAKACDVNDKAQLNKFQHLQVDDTLDLDLSYLSQTGVTKPTKVKIYFSRPFKDDTVCLGNEFYSAFSTKLINISGSGEEQLVSEQTNKSKSNHVLDVSISNVCKSQSSNCHLRLKPQVVTDYTDPGSGQEVLSGTQANEKNKYVYYALISYKGSTILDPPNITQIDAPKPGLVTITSVGRAGFGVRKLQAKVDSTTGAYLGIFDFGVYCGDKCLGRGFDEL